jgi:hypothetical protein
LGESWSEGTRKEQKGPGNGIHVGHFPKIQTSHSAHDRLGPLSVEQKKRTTVKRAKLEKSKEEERRPQEIKEEDIQRSENETTKNVIKVGL